MPKTAKSITVRGRKLVRYSTGNSESGVVKTMRQIGRGKKTFQVKRFGTKKTGYRYAGYARPGFSTK